MFFGNAEDSFALLMGEIMDRRNINFIYDDKLCINFFKCFDKDRDDLKFVLNKFNEDKTKITIPNDDPEEDTILDIYNPQFIYFLKHLLFIFIFNITLLIHSILLLILLYFF